MLDDSEYIQLEGLSDGSQMSLRLGLLSGRNSRRVSDNSLAENSLRRSIDDTVERNPCKRIGLHQVRILTRPLDKITEQVPFSNLIIANELTFI